MRKLNEINRHLEDQAEYYESNTDYSDLYLDLLGDTLQYDGVYNEDTIYKILDSDLTTSTDYSYGVDDAVAVYPMGEIEICIDTNLTVTEYNAIEDQIEAVTKFHPATSTEQAYIVAYICCGMNVRVYSDLSLEVA